ncbi:hypothetical protein Tco_0873815 [Tanacetum coccineum]|uniref:Uncharacterized protein n=1 Tax=Tanacetum coccineum TaxID=301880 RepID=A0ABQ5BLJ0_9ASTR
MTPAAIEEMINQSVTAALEAHEVNRNLGIENENGMEDGLMVLGLCELTDYKMLFDIFQQLMYQKLKGYAWEYNCNISKDMLMDGQNVARALRLGNMRSEGEVMTEALSLLQ